MFLCGGRFVCSADVSRVTPLLPTQHVTLSVCLKLQVGMNLWIRLCCLGRMRCELEEKGKFYYVQYFFIPFNTFTFEMYTFSAFSM